MPRRPSSYPMNAFDRYFSDALMGFIVVLLSPIVVCMAVFFFPFWLLTKTGYWIHSEWLRRRASFITKESR